MPGHNPADDTAFTRPPTKALQGHAMAMTPPAERRDGPSEPAAAAVLPAPPPPVERHLLPTGELAEVVIDIARVLAARPVAGADDWAALERPRNHPAVRALLSPRAAPRERAGGGA